MSARWKMQTEEYSIMREEQGCWVREELGLLEEQRKPGLQPDHAGPWGMAWACEIYVQGNGKPLKEFKWGNEW